MTDLGEKDIKSIITLVRELKGIDFSDYAQSSLKRRINRFFEMHNVGDTGEFRRRMSSDETFPGQFINEITVNVTEMFRDPSFWSALKTLVVSGFNDRPVINIWHAACSTGEEVVSMAIMLKEAGILNKCRLTATDLNNNALNTARTSVYPLKKQDLNSKNYERAGGQGNLSNYYTVEDKSVIYDAELSANTKFIYHDLSKEGTIGIFDIIICRNVFIYFNSELQERVVDIFSRSLKKDSILAIGSKESISWNRAARNFSELNPEEKIYKRI
jgi:chemotaxis protein methyltransferase CheR